MDRPQKITFGEMRESGVRGVLIYCADYKCSHHIAISGDRWPDELRLPDWWVPAWLNGVQRGQDCQPPDN
jgi:hypothetical protein